MSEREKLPDRRQGITEKLIFRHNEPGELRFHTTFNWEEGGPVREVFCDLPFKEGADMREQMKQVCIVTSVALQSGHTMADLARVAGEDDVAQKPRSIIGLIIRAGVIVDERRGFPPNPTAGQP